MYFVNAERRVVYMPIIIPDKYSSPVIFPTENYRIARYLDLTKFISILQKKSLFFCRLDKLEDQFEGVTSKSNYKVRYEIYANQHLHHSALTKLTEEEILKRVQGDFKVDQKMKSLSCVCCWNKNEAESAALWKIYSDFEKGIMITSTIHKLIQSLKKTKEGINLSEIKYINHNVDSMPLGNAMYPIFHKHKAYGFEGEIRLIHTVRGIQPGLLYDWTKEEVESGKYLKIDLDLLIDEIIVSPHSPKWYREMISDLCKKYKLNKTIKESELTIPPDNPSL